jgi:hypothetical protein
MTFAEFEKYYVDNMFQQKLELEDAGRLSFLEYFKEILLYIEEEILSGNRNIRLPDSIQETLERHATLCIEKLYKGQNLTNAEQAQLTALLVQRVNNRVNNVVGTIDNWTQTQIDGAIRRATVALEDKITDKQLKRLVLKHLVPIWKRRADNMVISETQGNVETIIYTSNDSAEEQGKIAVLLGDDEALQRQLESSTVFSYIMFADEVESATTARKLRVLENRKKQWFTMADEKVRPTHQAVHGVIVEKDGFFIVGGFPMQYPGDASAPPQEIVNCRCTLVYR